MTDEEKEVKRRQIQQEIRNRNNQISSLKSKRTEYTNMKTQINKALPKLRSGVSEISDAKSGLKKSYTGQIAKQKDNDFQSLIDDNNATINKLKNKVLPEIERKISSIDSQISSHRRKISNLQYQLYNL